MKVGNWFDTNKKLVLWLGLWLGLSPWLWSTAKGLKVDVLVGIGIVWLGLMLISDKLRKDFDVVLWGLMIGWMGISVFMAMDKWVALWWWLVYGLMGGVYVLIRSWDWNRLKRKDWEMLGYGFFGAYFVIFIMIAWFSLVEVYKLGEVPKVIGPFYWHNQMGGWLLMVSPTLLWWVYKKQAKVRWLYLLVYASSLALLVLTFSRGSYLSWMVSLVLVGGWLGVRGSLKEVWFLKWKEVVLGVMLAVGLMVIFNRNVFQQVSGYSRVLVQESIGKNQMMEAPSISWEYRLIAFEDALKVIQKFPVGGVGLGNFRYYYRMIQSHPWIMVNFVHNQPLQLAAEAGLGVGIVWLVWVVWVVKRGLEFGAGKGAGKEKRLLVLLLTWGFLAESLHTMIDMDLSVVSLLFWYVVVAGIIVGVSEVGKGKRAGWIMPLWVKSGVAGVIVGLVVYVVVGLKMTMYLKQSLGGRMDKNQWQKVTNLAVKMYPFNYRNHFLTGLGYMKLKDLGSAYYWLKETRKMYPYLGEVSYNLGIIKEVWGITKEAEGYYKEAIKVNPMTSPRPYLKLAAFYMRHGEKDKAREVFYQCAYQAFPKDKAFLALKWMYEHTDVIILRDVCEREYKKLE